MRKKKRSFLKGVIRLIIVAAVFAGIVGYLATDYIHGKMNYSGIPSVSSEPLKEAGVTNILLIGNDSREAGQDGRSDAMILLSISNETKTIHLTYEEAKKEAINKAITSLIEKTGKNSKIISQNVLKESKKNSKIELEIFIVTEELISAIESKE